MYAVIIAGGIGARFWPKSRIKKPKHLLNIINNKTMIENTIDRISSWIPKEKTYVITNIMQKDAIAKKLPFLSSDHIIAEPMAKNTAAAIGLGAIKLILENPEATMVVLPADHHIADPEKFIDILKKSKECIDKHPDLLLTLGITPTYPATGYGYIQCQGRFQNDFLNVSSFAEKPNVETAMRFIKSGDFYWNSGMFVWKAKTILKQIEKYIPDLYENLQGLYQDFKSGHGEEIIEKYYREIHAVSIDYGVMEQADNVKMIPANFGWSDVGSWDIIYQHKDKDENKNTITHGNMLPIDCKNCLFVSENKGRLIAPVGLENIAIIDSGDAILVTPMDKVQDVKKVIDELKAKKLSKYL